MLRTDNQTYFVKDRDILPVCSCTGRYLPILEFLFQRSKNPTLSSEQTEALSRLRKHLKGPSRVITCFKTYTPKKPYCFTSVNVWISIKTVLLYWFSTAFCRQILQAVPTARRHVLGGWYKANCHVLTH
jgi:hypothetical protein